LNVDTLRGTPSKGLELVDANGKTYSVTAIGMDESNATYHLAWDQMLPAGHYLLRERAPADGGLTDLAGASPVASGQPDGVLASFNVSDGGAVAVDPSNVGPIFSGAPQPLSRTTEIDPGTAATYRFVAMSDAFYQIQNFFSGSSINVSVIGSGFSSSYSQAQTRGLATPVVLLKKGVYFLQITNDGSTRETVSFELKQNTSADSLLMNGVGQGPALIDAGGARGEDGVEDVHRRPSRPRRRVGHRVTPYIRSAFETITARRCSGVSSSVSSKSVVEPGKIPSACG